MPVETSGRSASERCCSSLAGGHRRGELLHDVVGVSRLGRMRSTIERDLVARLLDAG